MYGKIHVEHSILCISDMHDTLKTTKNLCKCSFLETAHTVNLTIFLKIFLCAWTVQLCIVCQTSMSHGI